MKRILLIAIVSSILFLQCKKEEKINKIVINFTQTVDGQILMMGAGCTEGGECLEDHSCCTDTLHPGMPYVNTSGEYYNIKTLQYLISDITLHSSEGNDIILNKIHFIDTEAPSTLSFISEEIGYGNYTGISYRMGLENAINITDRYIDDSQDFHGNMFWPTVMGGGYHYMKLEGSFHKDIISGGFQKENYNTHTGALQMMNDPIRMDHSFSNTSNISLHLNDNIGNINIDINMEIHNWFQNPNVITMTNNGIMGDMAIQMQLMENGMQDVFSVNY